MPNEELLASFWDHVEDLRYVILKVLVTLFLGFITVFYFYEPILKVMTSSWQPTQVSSVLSKQNLIWERVVNFSHESITYTLPLEASNLVLSKDVELMGSHQYQLKPQGSIHYTIPASEHNLLILNPLEGVLITFKICFWLSLALTAPIWVYFILNFILPGLKQKEKLIVMPFIICSFICMASGAFFAYFFTIPLTNSYLESFNAGIGKNLWSLMHYIDYTFILLLGHIVAFELCLILLFMVHFRFLRVEILIEKRRYIIVACFVIGALLTPPDVLTQFLLACPLIGVYEIAVLYGKMRDKFYLSRNLKNQTLYSDSVQSRVI